MAKRTDANQHEIVTALRQVGASVASLHTVGHGVPDLLVGFRGHNRLLEVKTPSGKLTQDEATWHANWRGQVVIVRSAEEALAAIHGDNTMETGDLPNDGCLSDGTPLID